MSVLEQFPRDEQIRDLIQLAKREDLGGDDVTSRLTIPESKIGVGTLLQKDVGIVCGLPIVEMICRAYDERLRVEQIPGFHMEIIEGRFSDQRVTPLLRVSEGRCGRCFRQNGSSSIFSNICPELRRRRSGMFAASRGPGRRIYDTRKTIPGFALAKYAVRCGGGLNHRAGLYDGVLIKDNHLASTLVKEIAAMLSQIVSQSRAENQSRMIEVEVDTLDQFREVLKVDGVDIVLLDNMDCPRMASAVEMRNSAGKKGKLAIEASGGVTLETVRSIALTGVERISVGAITHSSTALDIGLEIEE